MNTTPGGFRPAGFFCVPDLWYIAGSGRPETDSYGPAKRSKPVGALFAFLAAGLSRPALRKANLMSAQSPSLTEILTKLGDDWSIVKNRVVRHRKKRHVDDADVEQFCIAVDEGQKCIGASDPSSKTVGDLHDALGKRACEEASQPTDGSEAVLMLRRSLVPSTLPRDGQKHLLGLTLDAAKVWMKEQADGWDQEDENRWEARHNHPFTSVLERVTVWTGISSDDLRKAALKHFDGYSDFAEKLRLFDDKGQTRELWERLVKECPPVLLEAGLMPEKPTDGQPLPPGTKRSEEDDDKPPTPPGGNSATTPPGGAEQDKPSEIKRPSENAFKAWRLRDLFGVNKQAELAAKMTEDGVPADQGTVSRWLKDVREYMAAGGVLPELPKMDKPAAIDPSKIDMGERQDGRTPHQRKRWDADS